VALGIATLLTQVWIPLAALHQAGALVLLALLLRAGFLARPAA
jgi:cytochrome c oxidase assembly protein subunit 15